MVPVGYSDHTTGMEIAIAAIAQGAAVLEKHLTLDRNLPGPDHRASTEPEEFREMVRAIRRVEKALGNGVKRAMPSELETRAVVRRSIVAAADLAMGTVLRAEHLTLKRTGTGIPPAECRLLIGRTLVRPLAADDVVAWTDVS